jgi:hypothetical protein
LFPISVSFKKLFFACVVDIVVHLSFSMKALPVFPESSSAAMLLGVSLLFLRGKGARTAQEPLSIPG